MTVTGVLRRVAAEAPPSRSAAALQRIARFVVHYRVALAPVVAVLVLLGVPALTPKGVLVADLFSIALLAVGVEAALALRLAERGVLERAREVEQTVAALSLRVEQAVGALVADLGLAAGGDVRVAVHGSADAAAGDRDLVRAAWTAGIARRRGAEGTGIGAVAVRIDARTGTGPVGVVVVDGFAPDAALRRLRAGAPWERLGALLEAGALSA